MKSKVYNKEYLQSFGIQIKKLRQNKGISQRKLAEDIGIKKSTVTRIELGQSNCSLCTVYAISEKLQIHMSDLFDFE